MVFLVRFEVFRQLTNALAQQRDLSDTCQRRIAFALWLALTCCTPVSSRFRNVCDGNTLLSEVANQACEQGMLRGGPQRPTEWPRGSPVVARQGSVRGYIMISDLKQNGGCSHPLF